MVIAGKKTKEDSMLSALDILSSIFLLVLLISGGFIIGYLVYKKEIPLRPWYINPLELLGKYKELTKKDQGRIGIWFWILIGSFTSLILCLIIMAIILSL